MSVITFTDMIVKKGGYNLLTWEIYKETRDTETYKFRIDECLTVMYWLFIVKTRYLSCSYCYDLHRIHYFCTFCNLWYGIYTGMTIRNSLREEMRRNRVERIDGWQNVAYSDENFMLGCASEVIFFFTYFLEMYVMALVNYWNNVVTVSF